MSKSIVLGLLGTGTVMGGTAAVPLYKYAVSTYEQNNPEAVPGRDQEYMDDAELTVGDKISVLSEIKRDLILELREYQDVLNIKNTALSDIAKEKLQLEIKLGDLERKLDKLKFEHEGLVLEEIIEQREQSLLEAGLEMSKQDFESEKELLGLAAGDGSKLEKSVEEKESVVKRLLAKNEGLKSRVNALETKLNKSRQSFEKTEKWTEVLTDGIHTLTDEMVELHEPKGDS